MKNMYMYTASIKYAHFIELQRHVMGIATACELVTVKFSVFKFTYLHVYKCFRMSVV